MAGFVRSILLAAWFARAAADARLACENGQHRRVYQKVENEYQSSLASKKRKGVSLESDHAVKNRKIDKTEIENLQEQLADGMDERTKSVVSKIEFFHLFAKIVHLESQNAFDTDQ